VDEASVKGLDGNGKRCVRDRDERRDVQVCVGQDIISSVLPLPKHLDLFDNLRTLFPRVSETVYLCFLGSTQGSHIYYCHSTRTTKAGQQATTTSYRNLDPSFHLLQILQASQPLVRCHPSLLVTNIPSTFDTSAPHTTHNHNKITEKINTGLSFRPISSTIPLSPQKRSSLVQTKFARVARLLADHIPYSEAA
jgi:hypothetical protein